jgi:hypothetical protein
MPNIEKICTENTKYVKENLHVCQGLKKFTIVYRLRILAGFLAGLDIALMANYRLISPF